MKYTLLTIFLFTLLNSGVDVAMLDIHVGDSVNALNHLEVEVVSADKNMIKYRTENGNDFSVTSEKGKVVYMENDWLHASTGTKPLFSDFTFGETSLNDIREKFATNGFVHAAYRGFANDTHAIMFNCFEFDTKGGEVLVTVTRVPLEEDVTEANVASKLKLDALIIAAPKYLDKIWGKAKSYDSNYRKITP